MGEAALAFKGEGLGNHSDGERAHLAGQRGDDGSGAGAGASAETGGDKDHVRAFEGLDDLFSVFESATAADFRIGARAQAVSQLGAKLDLYRRARHLQRLQVGIGDRKFHAFDTGADHAVDGVAAAAADADDFDLGVIAGVFVEMNADFVVFVSHVYSRETAFSCWLLAFSF